MSDKTSDNNKRIAKNTLVLYFRMFIIMAVTLFTSRMILKALGIEDFGIYNVVGGVVSMIGLLNSAMSVSTTRHLTFELGRGDYKKLREIFSMCFTIYLMLVCLFFVLAETVGLWFVNTHLTIPENRMAAANWIYQFSILSCVVSLIANPYNAVLVAHEKMNIYAYISIADVLLKLAIVYMLPIIPFDKLSTYGTLMFCVVLFSNLLYISYCTRHYKEAHYNFFWDKSLFTDLLSYSWWNLFGAASGLVKGQGLNILLNMFFTPAVNAARGIAYQINTAVTQFFTNFYLAVRPQITKYYAQNDLENMFKLVFRSSKLSFYLIFLISLPIIIETPFIIKLWLGQIPEYVVSFTRIIVLISAIDSMTSPLMTSCHATGNIRLYQSLVGTMIMFNIPISYLLLKYTNCGPNTVFYVSLTISTIALFTRIWLVKRQIPEFPAWKFVKEVFLLSLVIGICSSILPIALHLILEPTILSCCIVIGTSLISTLTAIYFIGLSKTEKQFVFQVINKKILHR